MNHAIAVVIGTAMLSLMLIRFMCWSSLCLLSSTAGWSASSASSAFRCTLLCKVCVSLCPSYMSRNVFPRNENTGVSAHLVPILWWCAVVPTSVALLFHYNSNSKLDISNTHIKRRQKHINTKIFRGLKTFSSLQSYIK